MGYALAGLAVGTNTGIQSSIVYITIYAVMNVALFSCLLMMRRNEYYYEKEKIKEKIEWKRRNGNGK